MFDNDGKHFGKSHRFDSRMDGAGFLKMLHRGLARQNMTNLGGSRKLNSPATRAMTQNSNTARMKMPPQKYSTQSITPAPRTITSIRRRATRSRERGAARVIPGGPLFPSEQSRRLLARRFHFRSLGSFRTASALINSPNHRIAATRIKDRTARLGGKESLSAPLSP
jgi:hypothetical protein